MSAACTNVSAAVALSCQASQSTVVNPSHAMKIPSRLASTHTPAGSPEPSLPPRAMSALATTGSQVRTASRLSKTTRGDPLLPPRATSALATMGLEVRAASKRSKFTQGEPSLPPRATSALATTGPTLCPASMLSETTPNESSQPPRSTSALATTSGVPRAASTLPKITKRASSALETTETPSAVPPVKSHVHAEEIVETLPKRPATVLGMMSARHPVSPSPTMVESDDPVFGAGKQFQSQKRPTQSVRLHDSIDMDVKVCNALAKEYEKDWNWSSLNKWLDQIMANP